MKDQIVGGMYIKYEKEESKLRKVAGGAWTINLDRVDLSKIIMITYKTSKKVYSISAKEAQRIGKIEYLGKEKKLIIPLKYWNITEHGNNRIK